MTAPEPPTDGPQPPRLSPLLPSDPPKVGDYWLDARLVAAPSGVAYIGHDAVNAPAILILLSEGAAADAGARERFAGTVNQLHIDTVLARGGHGQADGRLGGRYADDKLDDPKIGEDVPATPWVALAYDASPASQEEASRILAEVDMSRVAPQGAPAGPDYQLPWLDRTRPGVARLWPLPWPGRHDRAGWLSILVSWLLMLLLAALAVLIAILIFQQSPPVSPPPPVPTSASGSPQSGSPSPQSGSPSPQSGSPSPSSASASPSPQSGSPSPQSGSPSGPGSPTPNSRL
ncbi:MAG: hypothetical protein QM779_03085 [Propionicimonas sp.]|uniref:hypothetical protein n=1 Tax=Propionicimonas sp. TaxID=1955623 RepID=UPI003D0AAAED